MFFNDKILLISKHGKEEALKLPLSKIGLSLEVDIVDTDILGTFTGEIPRFSSVEETLRKKIRLTKKQKDFRYFIASEGSFTSSLIPLNIESLIFYDSVKEKEITHHFMSYKVSFIEKKYDSFDKFINDFDLFNFPSHSLLIKFMNEEADYVSVKNEFELSLIFKDRSDSHFSVRNDLRAHANPTRMKNINLCAHELVQIINENCPSCNEYGFGKTYYLTGLPCSYCDKPTNQIKYEQKKCLNCHFETKKEINEKANPENCDLCNP